MGRPKDRPRDREAEAAAGRQTDRRDALSNISPTTCFAFGRRPPGVLKILRHVRPFPG